MYVSGQFFGARRRTSGQTIGLAEAVAMNERATRSWNFILKLKTASD